MDRINYLRILTMAGLIFLAAFSRLVAHPANMSPIMAIALLGGAYFDDKRLAFLLPLLAMVLSDIFLGFYMVSIFVYISFGIGILIGFVLRKRVKVQNIVLATIAGSVVFFMITNFGSWLTDPMYQPLNFASLSRCYTLAIPFFRNTVLGDMGYVVVLFGSYALAERFVPALSLKKI